jgi:hypothetical protein
MLLIWAKYCGVINNANMLVAISMAMLAKLVQQCKYNIARVLRATMYMSEMFLKLQVVDCGLLS